MNTAVRTAAAALLAVSAGSGLAACGETVDVAPGVSVSQETNPREHQAYKDLAESRAQEKALLVKPFEHQLRLRRGR